jgi:glucose/arabinose dehydrogenase
MRRFCFMPLLLALLMAPGCSPRPQTPASFSQPGTSQVPTGMTAASAADASPPPPLDRITLPPGFRISYFASRVPGARSLCRGSAGTIFVGTRGQSVYALTDRDGDHHADRVLTIAEGLNMPNGVAFADGALYVAEVNRVLRYDGIEQRLTNPPAPLIVKDGLPTDRTHGWKFIAFGPDGKLYVPIGFPCNICPRRAPYGTINRMNRDGSEWEMFASGIRNSVGFDWAPDTRELWFTDNGRDWLGDDRPPDELNHAPQAGMDFGFPYCHGRALPDPEYNGGRGCAGFTPPQAELGPHVAALGMRFYTGTMFPERYRGGIFIAEHGSWNRRIPIGYRVMYVPVQGGRATGYQVFAQGWLQGRGSWGRPVDVLVMPDGALLVSDDEAGAVYRISYAG